MTKHTTATIRKAEVSDLDAIFVLLQAFAMSFAPERAGFATSARHLLADDSAWLAVAEMEGSIVGYCLGFDHYTFYANGRVSWVEEITVQADLRRMGIGAMLMQYFEQWASARGSKLVALATRRASHFYTALGYEETATCFRKLL
jgi:N-acetylglutamate synthase-like GNAT family acetyltransferase